MFKIHIYACESVRYISQMSAVWHCCVAVFAILNDLFNTLYHLFCGLSLLAFAAVEEAHLWPLPAVQPSSTSWCGDAGSAPACRPCGTRPKGKAALSFLLSSTSQWLGIVLYTRTLARNNQFKVYAMHNYIRMFLCASRPLVCNKEISAYITEMLRLSSVHSSCGHSQ